jgi:ATP-binding cassette, subfamily B, multidrug efflux pump
MLKKLAPFIHKYRLVAILCPFIVILEVVADIFIPKLLAIIIDEGIPNKDIDLIVRTGIIMILLAAAAVVFGILGSRLASLASMGFGSEVRKALFDKIQGFSFANLDRLGVPSLITRLTSDVNNLQMACMQSLRMLFRAPIMMLLALAMAISINARLAIIILVAIPLLGIALVFIMASSHPRFTRMQKKLDALNSAIQENLIGIRVVKAFVRSDYEEERFKKSNDELVRSAISAVRLVILNQPIMQFILYGCIVAIIWFGGGMVRTGDMLPGALISFIAYVTQIMMATMMLSMIFMMFTRAKASGDRVLEIIEMDIDIIDKPGSTLSVDEGSIEFQGVNFNYPGDAAQNVLTDINLKINSGETIGIIGATGSAKTSLVQLIPRLYDTTAGQVLVSGHDVRDYALKPLRDSVAVVLQNNTLFTGTIRDNLHWGNAEADDETLLEACRIAHADSFVLETTDGLDTMLGQGGVNLSGGQKQRLCIARALLKKPRILILDDSTSAVDTATDTHIRQGLAERLDGVTVLIIAQRINSIQDADRIVVLDDGRVHGVGNHDDLLVNNEIYRDVYQSQMEGVLSK